LIGIAKLPETPSTVAYILNSMKIENVLNIVKIWLNEKNIESRPDFFNVINYVESEIIVNIFRLVDDSERIILFNGLPSTILAQLPELGEFEITTLTIEPMLAEPGETVEIMFIIKNIGTQTDDYLVSLDINGSLVYTFEGILEPGESTLLQYSDIYMEEGTFEVSVYDKTEEFTIETPEPGIEIPDFDPTNIIVKSIQITPNRTIKGDEFLVIVNIENLGEISGDSVVEVYIDSVLIQSRETYILAESDSSIIFAIVSDYDIGTHELLIGDLSTSFLVYEEAFGLPWFTILTVISMIIAAIIYLVNKYVIDLREYFNKYTQKL
jgi:hypothetical protein